MPDADDRPANAFVGSADLACFHDSAASLAQKYGYGTDAGSVVLGQIDRSTSESKPTPIPSGSNVEDAFKAVALDINDIFRVASATGVASHASSLTRACLFVSWVAREFVLGHNGGMEATGGAKRPRVRVGPQGRIVIPAAVREEMGLGPGDELLARVEDGRLVLERREDVVRRLRGRFAEVPPDRLLSEELIAERREEAKLEARREEGETGEDRGEA